MSLISVLLRAEGDAQTGGEGGTSSDSAEGVGAGPGGGDSEIESAEDD